MEPTLRILNLEDDPLATDLALTLLRKDGLDTEIDRVDTDSGFAEALRRGGYGLILADYSVPGMDVLEALRLAREVCPEVPFVFLSGAIVEETAIEMLKLGASDYVLKQRIERLVPAVRRALREAKEHAYRKRAEEALIAAKISAECAKDAADQANRAKDHFLAVLSHELRTPLTPVVMGLSMLQDAPDLAPALRETLEMIRRNIELETRLIDDLLDVSRIARESSIWPAAPSNCVRSSTGPSRSAIPTSRPASCISAWTLGRMLPTGLMPTCRGFSRSYGTSCETQSNSRQTMVVSAFAVGGTGRM